MPLKVLDLSNTRLSDKNGIELFEVIIERSQIASLNLSRNSNLAFKFSTQAINTLKNNAEYSL